MDTNSPARTGTFLSCTYDWNVQHENPDSAAAGFLECGDLGEGDLFTLQTVIALEPVHYRIVNGKAVPISRRSSHA